MSGYKSVLTKFEKDKLQSLLLNYQKRREERCEGVHAYILPEKWQNKPEIRYCVFCGKQEN